MKNQALARHSHAPPPLSVSLDLSSLYFFQSLSLSIAEMEEKNEGKERLKFLCKTKFSIVWRLGKIYKAEKYSFIHSSVVICVFCGELMSPFSK
jgi:hypothetical protein